MKSVPARLPVSQSGTGRYRKRSCHRCGRSIHMGAQFCTDCHRTDPSLIRKWTKDPTTPLEVEE